MTDTHTDIPPRPVPPDPPDDDDCCRSGCDPCVFDLHAMAMERHRDELMAWEEKYASAGAQDDALKMTP